MIPSRSTLLLAQERESIIILLVINRVGEAISLSILELLEYGISRKDVSQSLASEIIKFEKSVSANLPLTAWDIIASGDYYFYNLLNSKVKLTDLGLKILERLREEQRVNKTSVLPDNDTTD